LERAIELGPADATYHTLRAYALMALNQEDQAVAEAKRGLDLDPLSVHANGG
jgi:Flp pilus assembly protein TadD